MLSHFNHYPLLPFVWGARWHLQTRGRGRNLGLSPFSLLTREQFELQVLSMLSLLLFCWHDLTWHAYEEMEITRKINLQNMFAHWNVTGLLSISESPQAAGCLPILAILCLHPVWPVCCIWHSPPLPPPAWQSCRTWTLGKWGWDSTVNFLLSQMYLAGFFSLLTLCFLYHVHGSSWCVAQSPVALWTDR